MLLNMLGRIPPRFGSDLPARASMTIALCCSGAAGLIYQTVWTRQLMLMLGAQAGAVSLSLAVFFLGLAAGSAWGGRMADRSSNPLMLYAIMEVLIGLWGLAHPLICRLSDHLAMTLLPSGDAHPVIGLVTRIPPATLLVLLPAVCMGATLPLAIRGLTPNTYSAGGGIAGWLYGVNTVGAMTGSLGAVFAGVPLLGYRHTVLTAAGLNLLAALLATLSGRVAISEVPAGSADPPATSRPSAGPIRQCATAFFLSGFAMLGLEVIWTRLLAMVFLGTVYAFSTMLAALLGALAAGGWFGGILARQQAGRTLGAAGGLLCLLGVTVILQLHGFARLPEWYTATVGQSGQPQEALAMFGWAIMLVGPAAFLSGAVFPLLISAVCGRHGEQTGRGTGILLGANTVGGVLGSLTAGFILLPLAGAHKGMLLLSLLPFTAGLRLVFACDCLPRGRRVLSAGLYVAALGTALWSAPRDVMDTIGQWYMPRDHETIFFQEGAEATVAVSQPCGQHDGRDRVLWINRVQATTSIERGVRMNRFQGVLPLLFDREPRDALFMCFGSGITCGTLAVAGFRHIDAVEISPEVYRAAPLFGVDNLNVMARNNIRFIVGDGRHFLKTTRNTYDFISFEPMPLAMAGVTSFYTEEYYRLCQDRLRAGGMVSQWIPLHSSGNPVVSRLFRTFLRVFPHTFVFHINADLFLIGSAHPLKLDPERAVSRIAALPELWHALTDTGLADPVELIASCLIADASETTVSIPEPVEPPRLPYGVALGGSRAAAHYFAQNTILRDDRPWAEYESPRWVTENTVPANLLWLESMITGDLDPWLVESTNIRLREQISRRRQARRKDLEALRTLYSGMAINDRPLNLFQEALTLDPSDPMAVYYIGQIVRKQAEIFTRWKDREKLESLLERLGNRPGLDSARKAVQHALTTLTDDHSSEQSTTQP